MTAAASLSHKRYLSAYLPPLLWALVIFILSSQAVLPGLSESVPDFFLKKGAHMFVYGMLFWLLHRAMRLTFHSHDNSYSQPIFWLLPAVICLFYAMTDEVHQAFVPGRFGTFRDIGYDLLGTFLAFLKRYRYI